MTHAEAMAFWFGRVNYEQRVPTANDLKLDRMRRLLELLGNPHDGLPIVHIAGSKGKGSTSAMLDSIARAAGYRTGLFTSPHLSAIEERIQINGLPITPADLTQAMAEVRPQVERIDRELAAPGVGVTFFEIATAIGFLHFRRRAVDLAIIEVGLGGRFDSTNVCDPLLAIITSISFDHMALLGPTLGHIAMEKAGIVKPGRPVLSGAQGQEARVVIEQICQLRQAPLSQLGRDIHFRYHPGKISPGVRRLPTVEIRTPHAAWPALSLGLIGEHQGANAALAVAAAEVLAEVGFVLPASAVATGLAQVRWPARLEPFGGAPLVVLDCAHNDASALALGQTLLHEFDHGPSGKRSLLFAASSDKDLPTIIRALAPCFQNALFTRYTNNPRSADPNQLAALWREAGGGECLVLDDPFLALSQALKVASPQDLICVTGSVFLAGQLRPTLLAWSQESNAGQTTSSS